MQRYILGSKFYKGDSLIIERISNKYTFELKESDNKFEVNL